MIPLKLTIEGIYSYQERQTIDFTELASNGLFGILGGVGSGKSSILEAITYALYGETERLNSRDRRGYNMMNLKSDRLYVEFDFMNHNNDIYRATREIKRNSKDFEVVRPATVQFYEQKDDEWVPMEHSSAENVIGLSYANFKRTIIIPQGQFKEFLELGATDRTNMMKDIFQLEQYDLSSKASALSAETKTKLDQIEGRLMEFESVNEDDIKSKALELSELEKEVNGIKVEHELLNERYQRLKSLKDDFNNLVSYKKTFEAKQEEQKTIQNMQKQLATYERIFAKFDRLLSDINRERAQLSKLKEEHTSESKLLLDNKAKLEEKQGELNNISDYYNQLSQKRNEEEDLNKIIQILEYNTQIDTYKERTINGELAMKEVENALQKTVDDIKNREGELQDKAKDKFDSQLLLTIDGWYLQNENYKKYVSLYQSALEEKRKEQNKLYKEIEDNKVDIVNFEYIYSNTIAKLNEREKLATYNKTNLELQQKMGNYASSLHEGEACPLCGSEHHPNIAGVEDVSHLIKAAELEIASIKEEVQIQQDYRSQAKRLSDRAKEISEQVADADHKLKIEQEVIDNHINIFTWQEFSADDRSAFDIKKEQSLLVEKEINSINKEIARLRKYEQEHRVKLDKYSKALDDFRRSELELTTKIETNILNLRVISYDDYKMMSSSAISDMLLALKKKNDETEKQYLSLSSIIAEIDKIITAKKSIVAGLSKRAEETACIVDKLKDEIDLQLSAEGYEDIKIIEDILAQRIDVVKDRDIINKFTIEFETLKSQINSIEEKLNNAEYDDSTFEVHEVAWTESKQKLEESNNRMITLKTDVDRLTKLFEEKKELSKEQSELNKRAENLRVMTNLFKAQGFVQYVSSIYLAQLCDHANVRFRRMTRNQLSLRINQSSNDFEIVDYLNEGKSRSVKTLSGGQAFQVSLSLALALAESVQTNAKADRNFFFIDEGFGTQDSESVNIVFETLLNLNKENKIVGIISHVEELKERIPMTLTVVNDQERGSLIQ